MSDAPAHKRTSHRMQLMGLAAAPAKRKRKCTDDWFQRVRCTLLQYTIWYRVHMAILGEYRSAQRDCFVGEPLRKRP